LEIFFSFGIQERLNRVYIFAWDIGIFESEVWKSLFSFGIKERWIKAYVFALQESSKLRFGNLCRDKNRKIRCQSLPFHADSFIPNEKKYFQASDSNLPVSPAKTKVSKPQIGKDDWQGSIILPHEKFLLEISASFEKERLFQYV